MTKRKDQFLAALLILATFFCYWPSMNGQMLWDDDVHIPTDPKLQSIDGLRSMWFQIGATPQYYPLTHTTLWLEWKLAGSSTTLFHVDNVSLHVIASLLVVLLLKRLKTPGAWLAGFIFALHPLHVESVAWISERKNTLSIVMGLLTLLTHPGLNTELKLNDSQYNRRLVLSLFFFILAVLSKTVICTLPGVILVLIWWQHGKWAKRDLISAVPFFIVTVIVSILTSRMEREVVRAVGADWDLSFLDRMHIAGKAIWWYLGKVFYPGQLAFSYSRWNPHADSIFDWLPIVFAVIVLFAAISLPKRIGRSPAATLLIFGGMIFPALSFFNLYPHRYSFVADHFQYHANIAMIAFGSAVIVHFAKQINQYAFIALSMLIVGFCALKTCHQAGIYRDSETLWRDTIQKTPDSWLAHISYADVLTSKYSDEPHLRTAADSYLIANKLRPQADTVASSLAEVYAKLNEPELAERCNELAITILKDNIRTQPDLARASKARMRLGSLYEKLNRPNDALAVYQEGDASLPNDPTFASLIVRLCETRRRAPEAIPALKKLIRFYPTQLSYPMKLVDYYIAFGQFDEARKLLTNLSHLMPGNQAIRQRFESLDAEIGKSIRMKEITE